MSAMASQIISLTIVYWTVYWGANQTSKLRVTGLYVGNSPVTGEFPAQRASNAENVSIDDVVMGFTAYKYITSVHAIIYVSYVAFLRWKWY